MDAFLLRNLGSFLSLTIDVFLSKISKLSNDSHVNQIQAVSRIELL